MAMKVTSITELDTDTPMHMIDPMNDSMLSVVPVASSMITTPQSTPGTARHRRQGQPRRLEVGGQQHQDHHHRDAQADRQGGEHLVHGRHLAARQDADAPGRLARGGDGLLDLPGGPAEVLALDVGGDAHVALMVVRSISPGMMPWPTRATSRIIRFRSGFTSASETVSSCAGEFIRGVGTSTWTW